MDVQIISPSRGYVSIISSLCQFLWLNTETVMTFLAALLELKAQLPIA